MKILIAPMHYVIDKRDGSEYTRAYHDAEFITSQKEFEGDILVGYASIKRLNNFKVHSYFKKKPQYISNFARIKFLLWIFFTARKLMKKNKYQRLWHNGPFAIGETFSLIALSVRTIPFILGPILTPHSFIGDDEGRSMGKKIYSDTSIRFKLLKFIDNKTYFVSKIFSYLSFSTLKRANIVIVCDTAGLQTLKKAGIKKVVLLPKGVNVSKFISNKIIKTTGVIKVISVSYLVERKRTQDLIEAINYLVKALDVHNVQLIIVGDGPQKESLITLSKKLGLKKYITFTGFVPRDRVHKLYKSSHIFVSASISESMAAMYFEAMAAGLPLVMVENQSTKDLIKEGIGGVVVPQKDPQSIAHALFDLIGSPRTIKRFGANNKDLIKGKFNYEKNMDQFSNIIKKGYKGKVTFGL